MSERPMYYDMQGRPIDDMMEWCRKFEDGEARTVAITKTMFFLVSTVWLGLDHNYSGIGPPLIFETMAFSRWGFTRRFRFAYFFNPKLKRFVDRWSRYDEFDMNRYSTLAQAKGGHLDMVEKFSGFGAFAKWIKWFFYQLFHG